MNNNHTRIIHVGGLGTHDEIAKHNRCHLFLAPLALDNNKYSQFCTKTSNAAFCILDCGSFEMALGTEDKEVSDALLLEMAINLGIHEVVCPDCPSDPQGSFSRSCDFIRLWAKLPKRVRPRLMIVPHGRTFIEWTENAHRLVKLVEKCTLGIPRILAEACDPSNAYFRITVAQQIRKAYPLVAIHLLGGGRNLLEELCCLRNNSTVRSLDTTFIHRYACSGKNPKKEYAAPSELRSSAKPQRLREITTELNMMLHQTIH